MRLIFTKAQLAALFILSACAPTVPTIMSAGNIIPEEVPQVNALGQFIANGVVVDYNPMAGTSSFTAARPSNRASIPTQGNTSSASGQIETKCERDRFADRNVCTVSIQLGVGSGGAEMGGTLYTANGGTTWSIVSERSIRVYRLRVDRNPEIGGSCTGPLGSCHISGAAAAALTRQIRQSDKLAVQLVGVRSILDRDVDVRGVGNALAQASAR